MEHSQRRLLSAACLLPPTSRGNKGGFPPCNLFGKEARSAGSEAIHGGEAKPNPGPGGKAW